MQFPMDPGTRGGALSRHAAGVRAASAALDPVGNWPDFKRVDIQPIKILGQLQKTPWQRFARLQRMAAQLAGGRGQPKGVFRFSSNDACNAWTANLNRNAK